MKPLLKHYLRLDARSLGLFRIAFGLVLIGDLLARWKWIDAFYSNEGVLPNHNHLYNLKQEHHSVWSAFHAFSTGGEAAFGFAIVLFFYVCFTLGWKTRAFHAMSLVSLVSLSARNLLIENWGNWIAIAILAFTLFLPLGSRFGVDALKKTMDLANDGGDRELNQRTKATEEDVDRRHAPGWSPLSVAALAVLLQLTLLYLSMALARTGSWRNGTALANALHVTRIASPFGFSMRASPVLSILTRIVVAAEFAIPALLFVPIVRGPARVVAAIAMVVHGLVFAVFFNFGLFGWTLVASSLLVVSSETWQRFATKRNPARALTVVYDADCGICFWLVKLLKRLDTRKHLTFQGNDSIVKTIHESRELSTDEADYRESPHVEETRRVYWVADPKTGELEERDAPAELTDELVNQTVVAIGEGGKVYTRAEAVAQILRAVPGYAALGTFMRLPGIASLANLLYGYVAPRRTQLSVALGLAACGTAKKSDAHHADPLVAEVAPSTRLRHRITGSFREVFALVLLASMLVANTRANKLPFRLQANDTLESIAWYSRMLGRWDVLTPEPPTDDGRMVVDAVTRDNAAIDTFTGKPPAVDFGQPFALGQLWSDYLYKIQDPKYQGYEQAFRTYVSKAGPKWPAEKPGDKIIGLDAYWATPVPADDKPYTLRRQFRVARGGTTFDPSGANAMPIRPQSVTPGEQIPRGLPMPAPLVRPGRGDR